MNTSKPNKSVLILGATGGFGSAITQAMAGNGWQVRALSREPKASPQTSDANINWVTGDLDKPESLYDAARRVDVIVHAVNVPYPKWNPVMINYTRNIIDISKRANAHLIFIGNIYNLGIPKDGVIRHDTPDAPINEKGEVRSTLEQMIKEASSTGLRATIMRFGDFFGPGVTKNNWFNECTKDLHKNKLAVAGPLDIPHTWAYLPDAARATEQVANARIQSTELPEYMVVPFRGHVFSFGDLLQHIETIKQQKIKVTQIPWMLFKALGFVWPLMRDIVSMRYLWQHDIQMDGSALTKLIGKPNHTSLPDVLVEVIPNLQGTELADATA